MKPHFKNRLLKLAAFLRTVPKHRFNMKLWAEDAFCGRPHEPEHNVCNTAACAAGWATTIPSFHKAGFRLVRRDPADPESSLVVKYRGEIEGEACRLFFGLDTQRQCVQPLASDWKESTALFYRTAQTPVNYLFGGTWCNDPKKAARRIERYIRLEEAGKLE